MEVRLRRYPNEPLEIVPPASSSPTGLISIKCEAAPASLYDVDFFDGLTLLYSVSLPEGYQVHPVDWRRFAYDHELVLKLLRDCAHTNLLRFQFSPWSDEVKLEVSAQLKAALSDLESIFDLRGLEVSEMDEGGAITIAVFGEHKNGEQKRFNLLVKLVD